MSGPSLHIRVVTPLGGRLDERARSVTACSEHGEFCMLPEHRPILAALKPGRLLVEREDGETLVFACDRGFLEGGPDHVNVITQRCAEPGEIDAAALREEFHTAERTLAGVEKESPEHARLLVDMDWIEACLALSNRT